MSEKFFDKPLIRVVVMLLAAYGASIGYNFVLDHSQAEAIAAKADRTSVEDIHKELACKVNQEQFNRFEDRVFNKLDQIETLVRQEGGNAKPISKVPQPR